MCIPENLCIWHIKLTGLIEKIGLEAITTQKKKKKGRSNYHSKHMKLYNQSTKKNNNSFSKNTSIVKLLAVVMSILVRIALTPGAHRLFEMQMFEEICL